MALFFQAQIVAELPSGRVLGGLALHAVGLQLLDSLFVVKGHLFVELCVEAVAAQEELQFSKEAVDGMHGEFLPVV
jgi:hypothetical protein